MSKTKRTQLFLETNSYRRIQELARQQGTSAGYIVRDAVAQYLDRLDPRESYDRDPLWLLADSAGPAGPVDGAAEHDRYLYGTQDRPPAPPRPRKSLRR